MSGMAATAEKTGVGFAQSDNEQIVLYTPLVKRIAYHLMSRLPPNVQQDDLIQAGLIGLLEALRNYDASQGASLLAISVPNASSSSILAFVAAR